MNWLAKSCLSAVLLICISLTITSCKKEGDFNLGASPEAGIGAQFTDTVTLVNQTFLLNDSIISARPFYMSFGGYSDPGVTGVTYAEAYTALTLATSNVDYTGVTIDSANLKLHYEYAYGDTLVGQDFAVHQVTTQMDLSVPYQTSTNFVTYDPTIGGSRSGVQVRPGKKGTMTIPLTAALTANVLAAADDRNNTDFQSNFYGIVIKSNNNSLGSVVRADFTSTYTTPPTKLMVYFKRGATRDSSVFYLIQNTPSFNKVITDRSGTPISSLMSNTDNISDAALMNKCYIQAGTGIVTKVTMPHLLKMAEVEGASVIVNKATLIIPIDDASDLQSYKPVIETGLLELNSDNTYKYRNGQLAYVQASTPNISGIYPNLSAGPFGINHKEYRFEITRYVQLLLSGRYPNDGFLINPTFNSYYTNRTVLNSFNEASRRKMRLEIYYTKVN